MTSKLCSACFEALQSSLPAIEKELHKTCTHHTNFADLRDAAARECFICVKLWDSISDECLADWSNDPTSWAPFKVSLGRRPWAAERYGAVYWHMRYLVFSCFMADIKYGGNVFCLFPSRTSPRTWVGLSLDCQEECLYLHNR
jgi:hypothetical protein